jgi:hypothetical protein
MNMDTENLLPVKHESPIMFTARVDYVVDFLLDHPNLLLRKYNPGLAPMLMEQFKNQFDADVSLRSMQRCIQRARKEIRKVTQLNTEKKVERHRMYLDCILKRCWKEGNMKQALHALSDIAKLEGLNPPMPYNRWKEELWKGLDPYQLTEHQLKLVRERKDIVTVLLNPKTKEEAANERRKHHH